MNRLLSGWKKHRKSTHSKSFTFFRSDNKDKIYTKNRTLVDKMWVFFNIQRWICRPFNPATYHIRIFWAKQVCEKFDRQHVAIGKKMNLVHKYMSIKMVVLMACVYTCVSQIKFLVIFFCQWFKEGLVGIQ